MLGEQGPGRRSQEPGSQGLKLTFMGTRASWVVARERQTPVKGAAPVPLQPTGPRGITDLLWPDLPVF